MKSFINFLKNSNSYVHLIGGKIPFSYVNNAVIYHYYNTAGINSHTAIANNDIIYVDIINALIQIDPTMHILYKLYRIETIKLLLDN